VNDGMFWAVLAANILALCGAFMIGDLARWAYDTWLEGRRQKLVAVVLTDVLCVCLWSVLLYAWISELS
jgi:hypothetical protein